MDSVSPIDVKGTDSYLAAIEAEAARRNARRNVDKDKPFLLSAGTHSTSSQFQRKRRRQKTFSATNEDRVLSAWLSSEIKANSVREELAKEKLELIKLRKRKLLLEIQKLESASS